MIERFFKTALIGAVVYLLPLAVVAVLFSKILPVLRRLGQPIARIFPLESVVGVGVETLVSLALLVLICFCLGYFAAKPHQSGFVKKIEQFCLHIPGYSILRTWAHSVAGIDEKTNINVVLVRIEDAAWQIAYLMEKTNEGLCTVFVPQSPSPFSGAVYFVPEDRVRDVPVTFAKATQCIRRFGAGSKEIINEQKLV